VRCEANPYGIEPLIVALPPIPTGLRVALGVCEANPYGIEPLIVALPPIPTGLSRWLLPNRQSLRD